jgi:Arc/MetJ family transcription regulator
MARRAAASHTGRVHRTTIVLDERKLARARKLLGTKGIKETVERALDEVIAGELRRRAFERLRKMEGLELDDPEVVGRAWR